MSRRNTFHRPIRIGGLRYMLLSGLQEAASHSETSRSYYSKNWVMLNNHTFFFIIFTRCLTMGYGSSRIARQLIEQPPASGEGPFVLTRSPGLRWPRMVLTHPTCRTGQKSEARTNSPLRKCPEQTLP